MKKIFEIRKTRTMGFGLFAITLIKKNQQILKFTGPVISFKETIKKSREKECCPLQIGPDKYIDISEPGVLINHSCSPNAGIKNDCYLIAIENIFPGQQIFYDYSTTVDEDFWTMKCKCGTSNCRKEILDFKYLPESFKSKYLELNIVQTFIKEKFKK